MRYLGMMLGIGAVASGAAFGVLGACAIDDDVTWITGEDCTGSCRVVPASTLSCDTDSSCTHVSGCEDWDCSEDPYDGGHPDTFADYTDVVDGSDIGANPACEAYGGGETLESAEEISLDVTEYELSCCPSNSRWFRFSVASGARFAVDVVPLAESQVTFLLYAEDGTALAGAEMDAEASFAAEARTGATYYLRVRSAVDAMAYYTLTVRTVVE